jgi:hypothetical protein
MKHILKEEKTMKKILALVLCLALALGMIPAFAEEAAAEKVEAYIAYANGDWSVSYWNDGNESPVVAKNAEITGAGSYTVGLDFTAAAPDGVDTAFNALIVSGAIEAYPKMCLNITAIRINGEAVEFAKGFTNDEEGKTRMNIYNEWVAGVPADARSVDNVLEDKTAIMVAKDVFTGVKTMEVDFDVVPLEVSAAVVIASADWAVSYWNDGNESPVVAKNAEIKGEGTYTVGLEFPEAFTGIAFAAVKLNNGNIAYPGYFIDVKEVKVNGEAIELGKGYTSSDDKIEMRSNLFNEWVTELPSDARRADGDLEGAAPVVVDPAAFTDVKSIEATFDFIYGEPPVEESEVMTEEEAKAAKEAGFHAYIGVQGTDTYVFRNAWYDNYGRDDADHPEFFGRLTGWDADNNAVDYAGSFADVEITKDGEYTVSLTTGDMGFGDTQAFNLLFVSTDIPNKLMKGGYLTISDVKTKIGSGATQEGANVNIEEGDYARIDVINTYAAETAFGYNVPSANETITITFTVSGMAD